MSEQGDAPAEGAGLIVGGSVAALRDLVEPPRLSKLELSIIQSYNQLVQLSSGPSTGEERGPAKPPPWVAPQSRLARAQMHDKPIPAVVVEADGGGLATTRAVYVNGFPSAGWHVVEDTLLLIPITREYEGEIEIVIRTAEGDIVARIDTNE